MPSDHDRPTVSIDVGPDLTGVEAAITRAVTTGSALPPDFGTRVMDGLQPLVEASRRAAESFAQRVRALLVPFQRALDASLGAHADEVNGPVHMAGLEARYYVRGGLDPLCADPGGLDVLVRAVLAGTSTDLFLVTPANRARIAAAAARGWVERYAFPWDLPWRCEECRGHGSADYWTCRTCSGSGLERVPHLRLYGRTLVVVTREEVW